MIICKVILNFSSISSPWLHTCQLTRLCSEVFTSTNSIIRFACIFLEKTERMPELSKKSAVARLLIDRNRAASPPYVLVRALTDVHNGLLASVDNDRSVCVCRSSLLRTL